MKGQPTARLLHEVAELEVPVTLDLWPAIRAQVEVAHRVRRKHAHHRPSWVALLRANVRPSIAVCCILLVLAIGLPVTVIAAQALPGGWQQRFGLVLISPTPNPTVTATAQSHAEPVPYAAQASSWISLGEAQRQVPFPIRVPTWLPAGLTIRGVIVGTGPTDNPASVPISVIVSYMPVAGGPYPPSTGLGIQQTAGSTLHGGYAIPTSQVQDARVNGRPAAYAHGAWTEAGVWDGTLDAGMLSWEEGGFTYVVHSSGLGLGREDLVKIAESLR